MTHTSLLETTKGKKNQFRTPTQRGRVVLPVLQLEEKREEDTLALLYWLDLAESVIQGKDEGIRSILAFDRKDYIHIIARV